MTRMWNVVRRMFAGGDGVPPELDAKLAELRANVPAPVFWMLGKTQSGKTTIIHHLTGAEEAVIGSGGVLVDIQRVPYEIVDAAIAYKETAAIEA